LFCCARKNCFCVLFNWKSDGSALCKNCAHYFVGISIREIRLSPGLPDGFFSNQKSKFGQSLEGLRWENVVIWNWNIVQIS
jgi:hypothetical protein